MPDRFSYHTSRRSIPSSASGELFLVQLGSVDHSRLLFSVLGMDFRRIRAYCLTLMPVVMVRLGAPPNRFIEGTSSNSLKE